MPINRNRQDWTAGKTVNVGFLSLRVLAILETPGDYKPDVYILSDAKGKLFKFTPYHGLETYSPQEQQK